jgi:hypothetical protein
LGDRWSKYGGRYGNNQDYDGEQNININNGCGGDGGEYFWYLGQTQCFRANAAYSLYGVLKGASHSGHFCQRSTYINSFFTTYGIESFGGPLGLDIDTANSYCTTQEPENGQNEYYVDEIDDDYLSSNVEFINYQAYTSYGTGCSAGKFVTDKYSGAFCRGDLFVETVDTLDSFNSAIESMGCTQIYSRSTSNGRELEDKDFTFGDLEAVKVLSFSTACDIRQYPQECPDPYGKKGEYASNMERSLSGIAMTSRSPIHTATNFCAVLFVMCGLLFMSMAYNVHRKTVRKVKDARIARNLRRIKKRRSGNPQEAVPPPSPPRESAASIESSEPSDFWNVSAAMLWEKIRFFTEGETPNTATPNNDHTSGGQVEVPPPPQKLETKRSRLGSFSRKLFGRKQ